MNKLSALSVNVAAALDNQRSGALVINLLLVQLQNNAPTLTTANCWQLVGGKGKPTKQGPQARTYFKANSLQRNAKEISEILKGEPTDHWHDFIGIIEVIDFTSATLQTDPAFVAAIDFMENKGNYACNGADVRTFIASLFEAVDSKDTTDDASEGEQQTAASSAADTVSHEANQIAGSTESEIDLAAAMLSDLAQVDNIIGKTIASLIGLDPVVAMQKMAEAWQADRARLLAEVNQLTELNDQATDKVKALTEQVRANRPAKAAKNSAMADAMKAATAA